jgi:cell division protein FtsW
MARFTTFLNPWKDYYGSGYQIIHSLIALGTGGWFGIGICEGREKMYIPEPHTDMIFPTIGEEAGLIGSLIVLALFAYFTYRGISIAHKAKSSYAGLLASGLTSLVALQALINVAVVTSSVPATGVPLPFISYGGSSLVFMLIAVGMILSVSRQVDITLEEDKDENSSHRRRYGRTHIPRSQHSGSVSRKDTKRRTPVCR